MAGHALPSPAQLRPGASPAPRREVKWTPAPATCNILSWSIAKIGVHVPVAQLDRASASGAEGCRFEPCRERLACRQPAAGRAAADPLTSEEKCDRFRAEELEWPQGM